MPTIKQQRAANALPESTCFKEALIKGGFSEKTAQKPKQVTESKGFKEAIKPIIQQLEDKRQLAIDAMTSKKIDKEKASELSRIVDVLTKNIELLSGRATDRSESIPLSEEQKERLKRELNGED